MDSEVINDNRKEQIIRLAKTNQILNYNHHSADTRILLHKKHQKDQLMINWDTEIKNEYAQYPISYDIDRQQNDIIDMTAQLLVDVVFNPDTAQHEKKLIIDPKNELLIKAFEGGLTFELDDKGTGRPDKQIKEVYPYTNLINCLHQIVYHIYLAQLTQEKRKQKKDLNITFGY
ncbi:MAG: hypothetical protein HC908_03785 [Calothrix sp. SM1_7_51]|nr:hypothetical protein [Calothrix sp. SM1_7_51]